MTTPNGHHLQDQSSNTVELTLLPQNYKNELFEQNLAFLKIHHSNLYNTVVNHKCEEYQLCSNPDGSPNIIEIKSKKPIYPSFTFSDLMLIGKKGIDSLSCNFQIGETFVLGGTEKWKANNPIQYGMLNKLYKIGIFSKLQLTPDFLTPLQGYSTDYLPLIRVYGIGLGYHLTELIKQKGISYITIYEPHVDLFFTSLFTIPWHLIFSYFDGKGKSMNLVIGTTPDTAITSNMTFIRQRLMPLTSYFFRLNHFNSKIIMNTISKEPQSDAVERQQVDAGWYEDQRAGFYISAMNIRKKHNIFSGKKTKCFFRAFIIGSGPSLSEAIDYLKTHQKDALIISCGSAISPLLKAGILPDYEVVQERNWQYAKLEEKHDPSLLKKITLLKLNVVSTKIDKYYKKTLVFQKFRDPGSSLLGDNYPVTTAVNPTVTNAGIAMCAELGVNEAYLFGVDYGAPKGHEKMHVANTIYDELSIDDNVESTTEFDLPGNLGAQIRTTTTLSWSLQTTEKKIAEHPNIRWFNAGEGAFISGTTPVSFGELPKIFTKKITKNRLLNEISDCFNNHYSPAEILEGIKTTHMQQVEDYFEALKGFTASFPQTREEVVTVLSLLYKAINIGQDKSHFLPTPLLSYGFKQFVNNVYIQSAMATDDESAAHFFKGAKEILIQYITDIEKDLAKILAYLEHDSEIDLEKQS